MNRILTVLTLFITSIGFSQYTSIPDPVFEQVLIDLGYDTGVPDGTVLTSNISVVDSLNLSDILVTDLTGIEDFDSLRYLNCSSNTLSGLLTNLDVSNNTSLTYLECYGNQLTSLDVSNNTSLTYLECNSNSLTSLDVSNTDLTYLSCYGNQLTSLDVSNNTSLTYLDCDFNSLTSLDVSNNTSLTDLLCSYNQLTSLDVSNNTNLIHFNCSSNLLECLNIKNGNNSIITLFDCTDNPNLSCIEVDNETYSIQNWTDIDSQQYFSSSCNNSCSSVLGLTEVTSKRTFLFPNPTDNTSLLKIDGIITDNLTVNVFNKLGQHVMSVPVSSSSVNLDINTLGKGTYIVKLIDDNNSVISTERLVKY
jgi:Leucine-rich repeat (LRR) protein